MKNYLFTILVGDKGLIKKYPTRCVQTTHSRLLRRMFGSTSVIEGIKCKIVSYFSLRMIKGVYNDISSETKLLQAKDPTNKFIRINEYKMEQISNSILAFVKVFKL